MPVKWVDNVLSHHALPGIHGGRQGSARRITDTGLTALALVRLINADFASTTARAVELTVKAMRLRENGNGSPASEVRVSTSSGMTLVVPFTAIEQQLRHRLVEALESAAHVRRGRPPVSSDA